MSSVEATVLSINGVEGPWYLAAEKIGAYYFELSAEEVEELSLVLGGIAVLRGAHRDDLQRDQAGGIKSSR
jgi:hypothetical protein